MFETIQLKEKFIETGFAKTEFKDKFFSNNWKEFQKIPETINKIKRPESVEEFNYLLGDLMQEEKGVGGEKEIVDYTKQLEKQLKNPEYLPYGLEVVYTPLGKKGGDFWQMSNLKKENGISAIEISFGDFENHGEKVANLKTLTYKTWELIKKNVPEKDWYRELDKFLEKLRKKATLLESGIASTMNLIRIQEDTAGKRNLELFGPASESWPFIIFDKGKNKVYSKIDDFKNKAPANKMKLGLMEGGQEILPKDFYECESQNITKSMDLSENWELYAFTDGFDNCRLVNMPENKVLGDVISPESEITYLEEKIQEIYQSNNPWEEWKKMINELKQGDDITMIRVCSKKEETR